MKMSQTLTRVWWGPKNYKKESLFFVVVLYTLSKSMRTH